jgi:outer membrane protein TolC
LAAAKFSALQAQVIGEIDRAVSACRVARRQLETGGSLLAAQEQQQKSAQAQLAAGAADQLDLLNAQLEFYSTSLVQIDNTAQWQQACGQLEDALQSPLTLPDNVVRQIQENPNDIKPVSKK